MGGLLVVVALLGLVPPEGVYSFTTENGYTFRWDSGAEFYYYIGAGPMDGGLASVWRDGDWETWGSSVCFPEYTDFQVGVGESPIRSSVWAENGAAITAVKNADGSAWVDPTTGHGWNWSSSGESGAGLGVEMFGVDWGGTVGVLVGGLVAVVVAAVGVMLGLGLVGVGWRGLKGL